MLPVAFYDMKEIRKLFTVRSVITAFDVIKPKDFYFKGEMHDFWEVVLVVTGSVFATADEKVYQLNPGQVIFHKPLEFHRIWSADGTTPHIMIFSFDAVGDGMRFFENKLFSLNEQSQSFIRDIIEKVSYTLSTSQKNGKKGEDYILASHFAANTIERFLLSIYNTESSNFFTADAADSDEYKKIVRILHENTDKNLSVPQIAKLCNMSVSSLKKKFSQFSGRGVSKYFTYVKMRKAIQMLCDGVSTPQISDALGFSSVNYFYAAFKRETGLTPKDYLNQSDL